MLHEVTDLAIDNHAPYGDACLTIPGSNKRMGSTSTISGAFIVNAVMVEAVANLGRRGIAVDIYPSANVGGSNGDADEIVKRWRGRIRGALGPVERGAIAPLCNPRHDYMSIAGAISIVPPALSSGQPLAFLCASSMLDASIRL